MVVLSLCTLTFLLLVNHCGGRRRGRHNPTPHPEQILNHPVWAKEILDPCYVHLRGTNRVKRDIEVELDLTLNDWFSNLSPSLSTISPLLDSLPFSTHETTPPPAVGFSPTLRNSLLNLRSLVGSAAPFMVSPPPVPSRNDNFPFPLAELAPTLNLPLSKSLVPGVLDIFERRVYNTQRTTKIIIL